MTQKRKSFTSQSSLDPTVKEHHSWRKRLKEEQARLIDEQYKDQLYDYLTEQLPYLRRRNNDQE